MINLSVIEKTSHSSTEDVPAQMRSRHVGEKGRTRLVCEPAGHCILRMQHDVVVDGNRGV